MSKTALIATTFFLVVVLGGVFLWSSSKIEESAGRNVEVRDGVQFITVNARGGYSPKISSAKAGIPTKLIMKTSGTYDCSSSLAIRSIGFKKVLPSKGETEIDIGIPEIGKPLEGVCSMGMYNFTINFI